MKLKNLKINLEVVFLIVVFGLFLWAGYGALSGHKISHDSLIGYFSADAIQDAGWAEGIKEIGHYKYFAPYVSSGFNDTLAWYATAVFQPVVMLSYLSGLEVYDMLIFVVYLFAVVSSLVMYFIIRDYNKNVAILSVPLMLYIFFGKFYNSFLLGQWGYTTGCLFVIAAFWAVTKLREEKSYVLLALFIAGNIYTHPSELAFILGFIGFYLLYNFAAKKANKDMFKKILFAGIISVIISAYYILILKLSAGPAFAGGGLFRLGEVITGERFGYPVVYIKFFGLSLMFIILGMVLSLKQFKKMHTSFLSGFLMLFAGYSNYLGGSIGDRAFQNRFLWPIYLSVFFGISLYFLAKLFFKEWKVAYSVPISILLLFIFIGVNYDKPVSSGLVDKERLDGLTWFHVNAPKDAEIFFFYGDPYSQTSILWLTKRTAYLVGTEDYIKSVNEKSIKREYSSRSVNGFMFHRTSFFGSNDYIRELGDDFFNRKRDICDYDYYFFDKVSRQPILAQYNMVLASKLLENENVEAVFSNNMVAILKNKKPGVECIEEQTIG